MDASEIVRTIESLDIGKITLVQVSLVTEANGPGLQITIPTTSPQMFGVECFALNMKTGDPGLNAVVSRLYQAFSKET